LCIFTGRRGQTLCLLLGQARPCFNVAGEPACKWNSAATLQRATSLIGHERTSTSLRRSDKPICYKSRRDRPIDIVQFRAADWLVCRFPPRSRGGNAGKRASIDRGRQAGSARREMSSRSRFGKPPQPSFPKRTPSGTCAHAHARFADPSSACTAARNNSSNVPILSSRLDRSHGSAFVVFVRDVPRALLLLLLLLLLSSPALIYIYISLSLSFFLFFSLSTCLSVCPSLSFLSLHRCC
jgi:hypothetical protein